MPRHYIICGTVDAAMKKEKKNWKKKEAAWCSRACGVSGQAVQPKPLASLKLSMAVYGQKLDGRPSR